MLLYVQIIFSVLSLLPTSNKREAEAIRIGNVGGLVWSRRGSSCSGSVLKIGVSALSLESFFYHAVGTP